MNNPHETDSPDGPPIIVVLHRLTVITQTHQKLVLKLDFRSPPFVHSTVIPSVNGQTKTFNFRFMIFQNFSPSSFLFHLKTFCKKKTRQIESAGKGQIEQATVSPVIDVYADFLPFPPPPRSFEVVSLGVFDLFS